MEGRDITIVDTTLRDGEQSPGVAFSVAEKVEIAKFLATMGVKEMEVGAPVMGGSEAEACKAIASSGLSSRVFAWNRAQIKDIEASLSCGVSSLFISCPVSDIHIEKRLGKTRRWVFDRFLETIPVAKKEGCYIACGLEDASRAVPSFLIEVCRFLEGLGVDRLRLCDTVGVLTPSKTFKLISEIKGHISIPIEMHAHNDFGLATANSLAGIEAGATFVDTTVLGIGERAGNASLEEVVMALEYLFHKRTGIYTARLREVSIYISSIIKRDIPISKPIVGENAFTHESGLHVDGVVKEPLCYEPFPPEDVGMKRRLIIGKHSNRRIIEDRLRCLGMAPEWIDVVEFLENVRSRASYIKIPLSDDELLSLWMEMLRRKKAIEIYR